MPRIVRRPKARNDLIEIWDFIADLNEIAADQLLDRVEETLLMLSEHPYIGRERSELARGLRSFRVEKYIIFYVPLLDGIDVIRIMHGARDILADDIG